MGLLYNGRSVRYSYELQRLEVKMFFWNNSVNGSLL
jgi:hypothetical protein